MLGGWTYARRPLVLAIAVCMSAPAPALFLQGLPGASAEGVVASTAAWCVSSTGQLDQPCWSASSPSFGCFEEDERVWAVYMLNS